MWRRPEAEKCLKVPGEHFDEPPDLWPDRQGRGMIIVLS
jgi:hypothetical protein